MSNKNQQAKNTRIQAVAFDGMVAMMNKIKEDKQFVLAGLALNGTVHIVEDLTIIDVAADFGACAVKLHIPNSGVEQWFDMRSINLYQVYNERRTPTVSVVPPPGDNGD